MKVSTLELDFYNFHYEKDIDGQDMEPFKIFLVLFDSTKLNPFMSNDSAKRN